MNSRIATLRQYIVNKEHQSVRQEVDWSFLYNTEEAKKESRLQRAKKVFKKILQFEAEHPHFLPNEKIVLTRCCKNLPERYTEEEMKELRKNAYFHEKGLVFNISPDYTSTIEVGLDQRRKEVELRKQQAIQEKDEAGIEFLDAVLSDIDAVLYLADSYRAEAEKQGLTEIADLLSHVPHHGAKTFLEALQFFRFLHFSMWCDGAYHNGVGRFDQIMKPWLQADLESGRLDRTSALELVEEFFLSFNRDSDLYVGVQQGDNGQSLMLGGVDRHGNDAVNLLTELSLEASRELRLIDPKINLRVSSKTSFDLLKQATELTKIGLGFPQYANDDIVIPGLVRWGYPLEDARNYTVAACWEFIIPEIGMDIPNIAAVSFPAVIDSALRSEKGKQCTSFNHFMKIVQKELVTTADKIQESLKIVDMLPCPFVSLLCTGRIEAARDVAEGNRFNNFGIHGTGFATAVDSLTAIKQLIFIDKKYTANEFVSILDKNFQDENELLYYIRHELPKYGNNDVDPNAIATELLDYFSESWEGRHNSRGGIYRTGTGSAMYYIWHANELPASPDGRLRGEPFPANYAPALNVQVKGPISVVQSFTKPHLEKVVNGGPLTIELHDSTFRNEEGLEKVAQLVQFFIQEGGHQLQLNTINREHLLAAQKNPEQWKHLIVRVWGWSGYFIELDKPYQDQIIKRAEMVF